MMRLAFMGTPEFAVPTLDALVAEGHDVVAVYSQPPRPAGRGKGLSPSPVHRRAEAAGIEVRTLASLRDPGAQMEFAALELDAAVVAAYGLILPEAVLRIPRFGCLNVHASLLPRWRGAAPIQRAILAGDVMTGVSIMQMERGLDTGPVYAVRATPIDGKTAGALTDELAAMGAAMMADVLEHVRELTATPQPDDGVTYAAKIEKQEARLDFTRPTEAVERQVRAFNPVPGAFFEYAGERIKLLQVELCSREGGSPGLDPRLRGGTILDERLTVACSDGAIRPVLVQRSGRGVMSAEELLRGFPIPAGDRLA